MRILRVILLFVLLIAGLVAILAAGISYTRSKVPVGILGTSATIRINSWDNGYVYAKGTWTIDQEASATPLNVSEISCFRDDAVCYEAAAEIFSDLLNSRLETYRITKWDEGTIEYFDDSPLCTTLFYVISRNTEKLTGRRMAKVADAEACAEFPSSGDLTLSFVSGFSVHRELERDHMPMGIMIAAAILWAIFIFAWMIRVIRRRRAVA
jgi:hypothetical protein